MKNYWINMVCMPSFTKQDTKIKKYFHCLGNYFDYFANQLVSFFRNGYNYKICENESLNMEEKNETIS